MSMSRRLLTTIGVLGLTGGALPAAVGALPASGAPSDPLAAFRWKARVLVVIAPDERDPGLARQRQIVRVAASGVRERDLVLVEGVGQDRKAAMLRQRFAVPASEFRAILVGKDGGDKLTSREPIGTEQLFGEIDAMPMRRNEVRQRRP